MADVYDDPKEWAKLAARLSAEQPAPKLDDSFDPGMWDDEEPTGVIGGFEGERPKGTTEGGAITPMPGTVAAHLLDEISNAAHAIAPERLIFRLGRGRRNDLQLAVDGEASREHAQITRKGDLFYVEDLGSTNGTLVNGQLVERARLHGGEELQIGLTKLRFVLL